MVDVLKQRTLIGLITLLGALVFLVSLYMTIFTFASINVLDNWTMKTHKTEYTTGEIVKIESTAYKKYDIDGVSKRTLVCGRNEYPLSDVVSQGIKKGYFKSETEAYVPAILGNLPATCKVKFKVTYNFYGFRSSGETNEFTVKANR